VSSLGPLLDVQDLDLSADKLRSKRAKLPERSALSANEAAIAALETVRAAAQAECDELARLERELGAEVATLATKAREVEKSLYSGTVTIAKELDSLNHELGMWKQKREEAEERELELLERIETADAGLAEHAAKRGVLDEQHRALSAEIARAEAAIDAEIGELESRAAPLRQALPAAALAMYDRLRASARLVGRAAVALDSRMCGGCRVDLPVMEYRRICDEPDGTVVQCVHCTRILIH